MSQYRGTLPNAVFAAELVTTKDYHGEPVPERTHYALANNGFFMSAKQCAAYAPSSRDGVARRILVGHFVWKEVEVPE